MENITYLRDDIFFIDNFLNLNDLNSIKKVILSIDFPWFYSCSVATERIKREDDFYFNHPFYFEHTPISRFFGLLSPILEKINPRSLIRIKANLYTNLGKAVENDDHTDYVYDHHGAIFYLNTNNGKTVVDNKYYVDSIENRILFFNPSIPHRSTHPTDQKVRVNISFNYF